MKIKAVTTSLIQDCLTLSLVEPVTILWNRAGLWGQIPIERVRNEMRYAEERRKAGFACPAAITFYFFETLPITVEQAEALSVSASPTNKAQKQ